MSKRLEKNEPTSERLEPVGKILERMTGRRPTPATCCRFVMRGSNGVQLRSTMIGNRRYSCESWVQDWMDAITAIRTPAAAPKSQSKSFANFSKNVKPSPSKKTGDAVDTALATEGI